MMTILVTGGAGFIGSNLVHYLLNGAEEELGLSIGKVINLDKLTYAGHLANLEPVEDDERHVFVRGDIQDASLVGTLLREYQVDAVVHLAAESHVDRSIQSSHEFIQTNVVGTHRLLEAYRTYLAECDGLGGARQSWSLRKRGSGVFLHVSTDEVFGALGPDEPAISEGAPYNPGNPYSASKAASDHLARAYHRTFGVPVVVANSSNTYGPYQHPEKLIPSMIRRIVRGESLPVYGRGRQIRDWLYVGDLVRALGNILLDGVPGGTYLVGARCERRNLDLVRQIVEIVHELAPERATKGAEELIAHVADRPGHDFRYAINPAKVEGELNWRPKESLQCGLRKTVEWNLDYSQWIELRAEETDRGDSSE